MVDLRPRPPLAEPTAQDLRPADTLTPPAPDLMERLRELFPATLPVDTREGLGIDGMANAYYNVALSRGTQQVIDFLQSILDAQHKDRS